MLSREMPAETIFAEILPSPNLAPLEITREAFPNLQRHTFLHMLLSPLLSLVPITLMGLILFDMSRHTDHHMQVAQEEALESFVWAITVVAVVLGVRRMVIIGDLSLDSSLHLGIRQRLWAILVEVLLTMSRNPPRRLAEIVVDWLLEIARALLVAALLKSLLAQIREALVMALPRLLLMMILILKRRSYKFYPQ